MSTHKHNQIAKFVFKSGLIGLIFPVIAGVYLYVTLPAVHEKFFGILFSNNLFLVICLVPVILALGAYFAGTNLFKSINIKGKKE